MRGNKRPRYYDRNGKPMKLLEWAIRFEQEGYKRVREDHVGLIRISTVWIGADHSFGMGPPLIFETMVFGGPLDGECVRYSTHADAVLGHIGMVERVRIANLIKQSGAHHVI